MKHLDTERTLPHMLVAFNGPHMMENWRVASDADIGGGSTVSFTASEYVARVSGVCSNVSRIITSPQRWKDRCIRRESMFETSKGCFAKRLRLCYVPGMVINPVGSFSLLSN